MRRKRMTVAFLAALLLFGCGSARSAEPVKIRIGWVVVPASLEPILFAVPGLARHQGKTYDLEPIHFEGTSPEITALASGELDIAPLAFSAIGLAIQNAHMTDLRIMADEVQDGAHGYYSNEFMVLKDGPIKTIEDLKGKTLATNALGTAVDIGMRAELLRHHLHFPGDYNIIEVRFPQMQPILAEHKADLITAVPPFSYDPKLRGMARTLFTMKDAFGTTQLTAWVSRKPFLDRNHAALVDLMEDVLRAVRWYTNPANHDQAVAIVAKFMKQPPERFSNWLFTKKDDYRDPTGLPDLAALQRNLDTTEKLGLLKIHVDVKKYTDLSIVKEANARLKAAH